MYKYGKGCFYFISSHNEHICARNLVNTVEMKDTTSYINQGIVDYKGTETFAKKLAKFLIAKV